MRFRTKVALAAAPVAAAVVVGTVVAVRVRMRKKRMRQFLPEGLREAMEELLRLKGDDFVPDGLGTSLYHRKLARMSDRQLLGAYALVKAGEVLRRKGVIERKPTRAELKAAADEFQATISKERSREELIRSLEKLGGAMLLEITRDALTYLVTR
ncbi:MAG: hypothetical protein J6S63_09420 [Atopobiaceae bacterium]|nr:hypothetical protein [Atopobiaceae bacterium]